MALGTFRNKEGPPGQTQTDLMKGASNGGALCVESGTFEVTYVDTRCRLGKVRAKLQMVPQKCKKRTRWRHS